MKTIKIMMMTAALALVWGCGSDDDNAATSPVQPPTPPEAKSVFTPTESKPTWAIDWTWTDERPDWKDPESNEYEISMNMKVQLASDMAKYSSDDDMMTVFIGGTCRGINRRSVISSNDEVDFQLYIQGNGEEMGQPMQLKYYCAKLKHIFNQSTTLKFEPNEGFADHLSISFDFNNGNSKYPYMTYLSLLLPDDPSYSETQNDAVFVFVNGTCRGICRSSDLFPGFKGIGYGTFLGEEAELRYYRAKDNGYYTLKKTITLDGEGTTAKPSTVAKVVNLEY